jgi:small subunit ribosomal protein S18
MAEENQQTFDANDSRSLGRDKDMPGPGEGRFKGRKRRKVSYLTINKIETVDYKDVNILRRFINDRGKILSSRQTGNTAKQQRMISRAIHRAREIGLLPFVVQEMGSDRKEYAPRRDRGDRPPREDRGDRGDRGPRRAPEESEAKAVTKSAAPAEEAKAEAPAEKPAKAKKAAPAPEAEAPVAE